MSFAYQKPSLHWFSSYADVESHINKTQDVLVIDERLLDQWQLLFPSTEGSLLLPVKAGEALKSWESAQRWIQDLISNPSLLAKPRLIGIGGGSVTDFCGFVASIYKRGVPLVLVPSTWLSAIDSAHGGKNAINFAGIKNALGTFYFPKEVWLMRELLEAQPSPLFFDAWSEALKMGIIHSQELYEKLIDFYQKEKIQPNSPSFWTVLPDLIHAKYDLIQDDPYDQKKIRMKLNLGHTLGHVIEAQLGLSHGQSVGYGLRFAYEFSKLKGILEDEIELPGIPSQEELVSCLRPLEKISFFLKHDKKTDGTISFVFIVKPGKTVIDQLSIQEVEHMIDRLKNSS